jgi:hypothetical protein
VTATSLPQRERSGRRRDFEGNRLEKALAPENLTGHWIDRDPIWSVVAIVNPRLVIPVTHPDMLHPVPISTVQLALHMVGSDVVSFRLVMRLLPPRAVAATRRHMGATVTTRLHMGAMAVA